MANKFLGALGLDVLVNKIKDVIAKLDTKQDNLQIPIYTYGQKNSAYNGSDEMFAVRGLKISISSSNNGHFNIKPNVGSITLFSRSAAGGSMTIRPMACDGAEYISYSDAMLFLRAMQTGTSWKGCETVSDKINPTVRFNDSKLQVFNGTEWIDFEFPTGTTVEEITADEVTNKFA